MNRRTKRGYMLISVLVIATILFMIASLATSANFRLREQNRMVAAELQKRADALE